LQLFGYVILENHLHFAAQAPRLDRCLSSFVKQRGKLSRFPG
jgi:hypothetical protein